MRGVKDTRDSAKWRKKHKSKPVWCLVSWVTSQLAEGEILNSVLEPRFVFGNVLLNWHFGVRNRGEVALMNFPLYFSIDVLC